MSSELSTLTVAALAILFLAGALLYSSVGQAGASGYLAAMALLSVDPAVMKPTALVLNILVAGIASLRFTRAGHFSWRLLWPFMVTSIPFAFIGGSLALPGAAYKILVGLILLYAAIRLYRVAQVTDYSALRPVRRSTALLSGLGIGLLSGLTGTGGGIFLSPLLLLMRWADPRQTAGASAVFILVNSVAGLLGQLASVALLPAAIPVWALAAGVGGWLGAGYGSRHLSGVWTRRLLALVLAIAALKLIFT